MQTLEEVSDCEGIHYILALYFRRDWARGTLEDLADCGSYGPRQDIAPARRRKRSFLKRRVPSVG
jgi:hypothetical protein